MYHRREILIVLVILSMPFFPSAGAIIPGDPIVTPHTAIGNFWVNYTWVGGANTDSYNVSINRNWTNGTTDTFNNTKSVPHGWVNISVAGYNAASQQLSNFIPATAQVPNNPIALTNVSGSYSLYEGQTLYIDADYIDADNDTGIFATSAPKETFDKSTGILSWKTSKGDGSRNGKVYDWYINVTDGFNLPVRRMITATVYTNIPGNPTGLSYTPGNFWVNYTWAPGANTDSFNVSINGKWTNGTKDNFINTTSSPHGWVNISIAGYNAASQELSDFVFRVTQIPNNPIKLTSVTDRYILKEGEILFIDADYIDEDNDKGIFSTNAAKGTFDNSTGILSWATAAGDAGVYNYLISVTDGYSDGPSSITFKVIIPPKVRIKFIEPDIINNKEQWGEAKFGHIGKYIGTEVTFNNNGEEIQYLDITEIYNNTRTKLPQFMLLKGANFSYRKEFEMNASGIKDGLFNYTFEVESKGFNGQDYTSFFKDITTISLPVYPIFKIKRASHDLVYISRSSTTQPITYTLEAKSSINLINVSIYDPFFPASQGGPFFNISTLEANKPNSTNYTYQVTENDLSSKKCDEPEPYRCIINLATFSGEIESSNGLRINDTEYVEIEVREDIGNEAKSSSSPSSGGGGGGGGIPPTEDFNNIERREVREMDVLSRFATAYTFKSADPVMAVSFESSVSQDAVPVVVEVLKNRSKRIGIDVQGNRYKYFNIFVGMSGFSKKVSNGIVIFSVNNSWIKENGLAPEDIKLYKWQDDGWVEKTTEIADNNTNQTYYASLVGNFSSFAVSGDKKQDVVPTLSQEPEENTTQAISDSPVKSPIDFNLVLGIFPIIGIIGLAYYFRMRGRKNNK